MLDLFSRDMNLFIAVLTTLLLCITQRGFSRLDLMENSNEDVLDVLDYGAVGDGITDDSQAFIKAWTDLCRATTPSPILVIPSEKTFLLNPVTFKGHCSSTNPHVQVLGNIVAPNTISTWSGFNVNEWLVFSHIAGLILEGSGQIDGQGSIWWSGRPCINHVANGNCGRPSALRFVGCDGLQLRGLRHLNSPRNHISIVSCNDVMISNINIIAPENSPNTDGIDIASSTHIQIRDSFVGTGDDCIAINGGSSFINITNLACGPGHGISVGSLGKNKAHETVEEIHVERCNFTRTMNGVRIKTWQGGSGYVRKISFRHIELVEVINPIIIDQFYCPSHMGCQNYTSAVEVSDITYEGIHGTSVSMKAISLICSQSLGCNNILMNNINLISSEETHSYCFNAHGRALSTSPTVPCLS